MYHDDNSYAITRAASTCDSESATRMYRFAATGPLNSPFPLDQAEYISIFLLICMDCICL